MDGDFIGGKVELKMELGVGEEEETSMMPTLEILVIVNTTRGDAIFDVG